MISTEQRQLRKQFIGSSDAPAVCGVDPHRSAADVWADKTERVDDFEGNDATDRGNLLEGAVVDWAEQRLGVPLGRHKMVVSECGLLAANLDALSHVERFIVEAKTTVNPNPDEWGEEGTDAIPARHIVQVHHGLYVAGPEFRLAYVPVLLPGFKSFDFRLYRVERDDELAERVAGMGREFMERYVRPGVRPEDFRPSLEVLRRWRREPNRTVDVPDELVDGLVAAREAERAAKDAAKSAEQALLTSLGDAEAGNYSRGTIAYLETTRKGYAVEPCAFRTLRVKPAKEKKS